MKRTCRECGKEFELQDGEIQFYKEKGLALPKRCQECRDKKKYHNKPSGNQIQQKNTARKKNNGMQKNSGMTKQAGTQKSGAGKKHTYLPDNGNSVNHAQPPSNGASANHTQSPNNGGANHINIPESSHTETAYHTQEINRPAVKENAPKNSAATEKNNAPIPKKAKKINRLYTAAIIFLVIISGLFGNRFLETGSNAGNSQTQTESNQHQENQNETGQNETGQYQENKNGTNQNETAYHFRNEQYLAQHFEKHGGDFTYATKEEYETGANKVITSADALHKLEAEDGDDVYYLESTNEFVIVSTDGYIRTYFKPESGIDYYNRQ